MGTLVGLDDHGRVLRVVALEVEPQLPAEVPGVDGGGYAWVAVSCVLTTFYTPADTPTALSVLIPVFVLAIPLVDAATVVVIRLRLHKPIYVGDNRHISHRFVNLGLPRPLAVFLVWLLAFITGAGALTLLWLPPFGAWLVLAQFAAMMAIILILQFHVDKNQS